jgi:ABC-type polysaccharide/polyol phosphate transport system ATPase subunit
MASIFLTNITVEYNVFGVGSFAAEAQGSRGAGSIFHTSNGIKVKALTDIHLEVPSGVRLALIGRNGCGKTTLLRILAGIYEPLTGTRKIEGKIETLLNIWLGVSPEATGWRNLILHGLMEGLTHKESEKRAGEIAEFTELGSYLNLPVNLLRRHDVASCICNGNTSNARYFVA